MLKKIVKKQKNNLLADIQKPGNNRAFVFVFVSELIEQPER